MLTDREVLSTLNMLRNEHLDVRTVTLGISLFDCASHDFDVFAYRVRAKIAKYAAKLVATCNEVGDKFGIPVVNKRISVSPIGVVGASFSRDQMVRACQVLDESAKDAGVDFLGGFGALVEKGITPGERNLIAAGSPCHHGSHLFLHQRGLDAIRHQYGCRGPARPAHP